MTFHETSQINSPDAKEAIKRYRRSGVLKFLGICGLGLGVSLGVRIVTAAEIAPSSPHANVALEAGLASVFLGAGTAALTRSRTLTETANELLAPLLESEGPAEQSPSPIDPATFSLPPIEEQ